MQQIPEQYQYHERGEDDPITRRKNEIRLGREEARRAGIYAGWLTETLPQGVIVSKSVEVQDVRVAPPVSEQQYIAESPEIDERTVREQAAQRAIALAFKTDPRIEEMRDAQEAA